MKAKPKASRTRTAAAARSKGRPGKNPVATQLTIRGVDARLRRRIEDEAERRGRSLNQCVLELLREGAKLEPSRAKPELNHDYDEFFGTWTKEEAEEFDKRVAEMRKPDPKMWS